MEKVLSPGGALKGLEHLPCVGQCDLRGKQTLSAEYGTSGMEAGLGGPRRYSFDFS